MTEFIKKLFSFFILFFPSVFMYSAPSLEPSVLTGLDGSGEVFSGELSPHQIIRTALDYSLCPSESEEGQACFNKYLEVEKSAHKKFDSLPKIEAAEKLLPFMYETLLFRYHFDSTRLNTALLTGEYNCVTASVIYLALAKSFGIEVYGQITTLHAFCSVYFDGQKIDVETTNPHGFNPGVRKTVSETENSRRYATVPKKYYAGRREVSDRAMATLTGKNLASEFNDAEDYDKAVPLEISRLYFLKPYDENEAAVTKGDLDTLVQNYCINLNKQKKCAEAIEYISTVENKFGSSAELKKTLDNSLYNGTADLLNEEKYDEARAFFDRYSPLAGEAMQAKTDQMITQTVLKNHEVKVHNKVVPLFNSRRFDEAKQLLEEALVKNPGSRLLKNDLLLVNKNLGSQ